MICPRCHGFNIWIYGEKPETKDSCAVMMWMCGLCGWEWEA